MARTRNLKSNVIHATHGSVMPRGFHLEYLRRTPRDEVQTFYVRDGHYAVECDGEAHSNAHIDNCMVCLGHAWGVLAVLDAKRVAK